MHFGGLAQTRQQLQPSKHHEQEPSHNIPPLRQRRQTIPMLEFGAEIKHRGVEWQKREQKPARKKHKNNKNILVTIGNNR